MRHIFRTRSREPDRALDRALDRVGKDLERADPIGHRIHVACACLFCYAMGGPVSPLELATIPLLLVTLGRAWRSWRVIALRMRQKTPILVLVFIAWSALSLFWTPDRAEGADHLATLRWAWVLVALAPVAGARRALLIAMLCGLVVGVCVQLVNWAGPALGLFDPIWKRAGDRHSGWWFPVTGGTLLSAGLGLACGMALWARTGRGRANAGMAGGAILLGVLATGTRGAWVAAVGTLAIAGVCAVVLARPRSRPVLIGASLACLVALVAWLAIGDSVARRFDAGVQEVARAIEQGDYKTDTGARVGMMLAGVDQFRAEPVTGVGIGGFRAWNVAHARDTGEGLGELSHMHAHNTVINTAATLGAPGLVLLLAVFLSALLDLRGQRGPEAAGVALALVGLALVSMFDTLTVSSQGCAMSMILIALARHPRGEAPEAPA